MKVNVDEPCIFLCDFGFYLFVYFQNRYQEMCIDTLKKKASEWNIMDFLNKCELEPFECKINCYLLSLDNIANKESSTRAKKLLEKYREVSINFYQKCMSLNRVGACDLLGCLMFRQ